mmetsp:Transcript_11897/g.30873  ORF Transcript_11897/g.30873 Transcript_11897/m.30873 type:complete len:337 (-) Transcript_11897:420-1430(-)
MLLPRLLHRLPVAPLHLLARSAVPLPRLLEGPELRRLPLVERVKVAALLPRVLLVNGSALVTPLKLKLPKPVLLGPLGFVEARLVRLVCGLHSRLVEHRHPPLHRLPLFLCRRESLLVARLDPVDLLGVPCQVLGPYLLVLPLESLPPLRLHGAECLRLVQPRGEAARLGVSDKPAVARADHVLEEALSLWIVPEAHAVDGGRALVDVAPPPYALDCLQGKVRQPVAKHPHVGGLAEGERLLQRRERLAATPPPPTARPRGDGERPPRAPRALAALPPPVEAAGGPLAQPLFSGALLHKLEFGPERGVDAVRLGLPSPASPPPRTVVECHQVKPAL